MEIGILQPFYWFSGSGDFSKHYPYFITLVRKHEIKTGFSHYFFRAVSKNILDLRADVGILPIQVNFPDYITGFLNHCAKTLFAFAQCFFRFFTISNILEYSPGILRLPLHNLAVRYTLDIHFHPVAVPEYCIDDPDVFTGHHPLECFHAVHETILIDDIEYGKTRDIMFLVTERV